MSREARQPISIVICMEIYRTPEQTYTEDDYVVDGIKLLRLPYLPSEVSDETESVSDYIRKELTYASGMLIKDMLRNYREGSAEIQESLSSMFPRASKMIREGLPHWYHVTTDGSLSNRPQEFNSGGFSEAELLGTSDSESELEAISIYLNSEGDEIEAPPDKFMLSIGAA